MPSHEELAVTPGHAQDIPAHSDLLDVPHDITCLIIDYCKPHVDFTAVRNSSILRATVERYHQLAYVCKTLNLQFRTHPDYPREMAAFAWLWTLNRLTANTAYAGPLVEVDTISSLIDSPTAVRLPGQPHAQRRRTDLLLRQLISRTKLPVFEDFLSHLFDRLRRGAFVDDLMFIDLGHLALSALKAAVELYGSPHDKTIAIVNHITGTAPLDALPPEQRAAFWAELINLDQRNLTPEQRLAQVGNLTPKQSLLARKKLRELTTTYPAACKFAHRALLFLNDPTQDDHREAVIAHLETDGISWTQLTIDLLNHLAWLFMSPKGVLPLSKEQRARVRLIPIRHIAAIHNLFIHFNAGCDPRESRFPRLPASFFPAFSELAIHDKLKFVDIMTRSGVYSIKFHILWPMLESAVSDPSIPISQRQDLVESLLSELQSMGAPDSYEASKKTLLKEWYATHGPQ